MAAIRLGGNAEKLAMYEAPYNDDEEARRGWKEYIKRLTELLTLALVEFFADQKGKKQ